MKTLMLATVFLLLSAGPAFAQPEPDGDPPRMPREQLEKLNLSDQQRSTLRDLRRQTQKEMIDLRAEQRKLRIDMQEMREAESADRAAFEQQARKMADLQVRQKLLLFDARENMMKELTPEQQEQFREMMSDRMQRRGKDMKRGARPQRDGVCRPSARGPRR